MPIIETRDQGKEKHSSLTLPDCSCHKLKWINNQQGTATATTFSPVWFDSNQPGGSQESTNSELSVRSRSELQRESKCAMADQDHHQQPEPELEETLHIEESIRMTATPLLFLLDGCLSQDEDRVQEALQEIAEVMGPAGRMPALAVSPCFCPVALCRVLTALLAVRPDFCRLPSEHDGSLPLHFAASLGNVEVASIVFHKFPQAASIANKKGKIPLHYASREGRLDMVRFFLRHAPETVQIGTDKGKLALHFAAGEGHATITSLLLHHYPQSAAIPSNPKGKLPLHFSARWGYIKIAHELLEYYPDAVRALDWEGSLPLHDAAREGQYRMARYLIERFPVALQTANLRGEIPLFPAVRSSNVDLVCLMIQAWPAGGKHILRNVSQDDNVSSWNWDIIELLLRGAVDHLHGCALLDGREPPTVQLTDDIEPTTVASPEEVEAQKKKAKKARKAAANDGASSQPLPRLVEAPGYWMTKSAPFFAIQPPPTFAVIPPRCKSPLLNTISTDESISDSTGGDENHRCTKHSRKRSRSLMQSSKSCGDFTEVCGTPSNTYKPSVFLPLHAALESKSSIHVIRHVLSKFPDHVSRKDRIGRLPLHHAVAHCRTEAMVKLLLGSPPASSSNDGNSIIDGRIFFPQAARILDRSQQLPIHLAVHGRADVRVIQALLESNPEAGVAEQANLVELATESDCDLSTVYALLRVDPSFVCRLQQQQHL